MGNPEAIKPAPTEPEFDDAFRERLETLFRWRRDVRRFRTDAIAPEVVDELLEIAALAPSVGHSQPWRFAKVNAPDLRAEMRANFEASNADALADFAGERARLYASLKLEGMDKAPVQIAVFVDEETPLGDGLGQKTMPETLAYSVVSAINILWLAARARGIGMGWVSIIDPDRLAAALEVPESWSLVAYLCIGYPEEENLVPELHRTGWEERRDVGEFVIER